MEVSYRWPIQQTKLCQLQLLSIAGDKINNSNNRTRSIWGHHGNMEITVYGISGQKESGCNLNKTLRLNSTFLDSTRLMLLKYFCVKVPTIKNIGISCSFSKLLTVLLIFCMDSRNEKCPALHWCHWFSLLVWVWEGALRIKLTWKRAGLSSLTIGQFSIQYSNLYLLTALKFELKNKFELFEWNRFEIQELPFLTSFLI